MSTDVLIICNSQSRSDHAQALAQELEREVLFDLELKAIKAGQLALVFDDEAISLRVGGDASMGPLLVDFVGGKLGYRRQLKGQAYPDIAKAIGLTKSKCLSVLDVTAGLGQDAFVLALLGCRVELTERNPVVFTLLQDGLRRAQDHAQKISEDLLEVMQRMSLVPADAVAHLNQRKEGLFPDVIYVDPMFPERQKSAKVKKNMQMFHQLVGADEDSAQLLELALQRVNFRVVVKRPLKAEFLADRKPTMQVSGRSIRYDVYVCKKIV